MAKEFELVRKIAILGGREGGTTKEINIVRWGQFGPQIDIRRWKAGEPGKGITLNEAEARKLLQMLSLEFPAGSAVSQ